MPIFGLYTIMLLMNNIRPWVEQAVSGHDLLEMRGMYVNTVFRISDTEIRFFYLKNIEARGSLEYWNGRSWETVPNVAMRLNLPPKPDCIMRPHLGVGRLDFSSSDVLWLRDANLKEVYDFAIKDVRRPHNQTVHPHKLGTCLQPLTLHADWTIVLQYFEYWMAIGATKIYVYLHSATDNVQAVLDFYQEKLGDTLEIIPWSSLPVNSLDDGDFFADPNTRVMNVANFMMLNDCVYRARNSVKYLTALDLDEVFYLPSGQNPAEMFAAQDNSTIGTFLLPWIYTEHNNENSKATSINSIAFNPLDNLYHPKGTVFGYMGFMKPIHKPEHVIMTEMHLTNLNEVWSKSHGGMSQEEADGELKYFRYNIERYKEVCLNTSSIGILHLRRFVQKSPIDHRTYSSGEFETLRSTFNKMTQALKKRTQKHSIQNHSFAGWRIVAEATMRDVEECKFDNVNRKQRLGGGRCEAPQIWTNIAKRGKIIKYYHED